MTAIIAEKNLARDFLGIPGRSALWPPALKCPVVDAAASNHRGSHPDVSRRAAIAEPRRSCTHCSVIEYDRHLRERPVLPHLRCARYPASDPRTGSPTRLPVCLSSYPVLPLSPGRLERYGFEYRHGTLSMYAALDVKTGKVHGKTAERHTSDEFVDFLAAGGRVVQAGSGDPYHRRQLTGPQDAGGRFFE